MTQSVTCLFLGSGASRELANIPTSRHFLGPVLEEGRDQWIDDYKPENKKLKIGDKSLSQWMSGVEDIELVMSYLHNVAYSEPFPRRFPAGQRQHAYQAIINMRAAIAVFLDRRTQTEFQNHSEKHQKIYNKFIKNRESNLVILTTNYDLVFEKLLSEYPTQAGQPPFYYPGIELTPNSPFKNIPGGIPIYKLHGSVNWLEERWFSHQSKKQLKSVHPPDVYVPSIQDTLPHAEPTEWAYLFEMNGKTYNPIFIPFVFQKDYWLEIGRWTDILENHWNSAKKYFEESELTEIFFLGYSLQPADHRMLNFLLEIINKPNNPHVQIINKSRKDCKKTSVEREPLEKVLHPFISDESQVYRCGLENFLNNVPCQ